MLQVALFYSVVLTKSRRITSADLMRIAEAAGVEAVATVLSTGNLLLRGGGDEVALEQRLEAATESLLGKAIPVFVRSAQEVRALIAANPFPDENPSRVAVRVLRHPASPASLDRIAARLRPGEYFAAQPRALWLATTTDLSASPLLTAVSARWVGQGTLRSASALGKIAAALPEA